MDRSRPRLLFLCQTLPFPPHSGVAIRSYHTMRLLARDFEVTSLCFFRRSRHADADAVRDGVEGLSAFASVEAFPIEQEYSRVRLLRDHIASVMRRQVYTRYAYAARGFRDRLSHQLRAERYEVIHLDSLDLSAYVDALPAVPVVCSHHNAESLLLRRRAEWEVNPLRRHYLALQGALMEREERLFCGRFALNVTCSDEDAAYLRIRSPTAKFATLPNGVDVKYFQPRPPSSNGGGIVFVGGLDWFPNRDALRFFAKEIYPRLARGGAPPLVRWIGRANAASQRQYRRHGIELTGYVPDVRSIVQEAACYVAPLRVGGGTRLKILDAWAMGKAVVSTSIGCEGLAARDGENILIRDDAPGFAAAVEEVLADEGLRRRLGEAARATVEWTYDWEIIGRRMAEAYRRMMTQSRTDESELQTPPRPLQPARSRATPSGEG